MDLFDENTYQLHQKRIKPNFKNHSFLFDHVAENLISRIKDIKQDFAKPLNLSAHPLPLACEEYAQLSETLPYPDHSFDLVLNCLQAHWINNLPKFLAEILRVLKPNGLFLGALFGGNTLMELRESFLQAELALTGGATPRTSPMLLAPDAAQLLGKTGFKEPVIDCETLGVTYRNLSSLMKDLRGMGESNKLKSRQKVFTSRRLLQNAEEFYRQNFVDKDGKLITTFEVISLTGWASAHL